MKYAIRITAGRPVGAAGSGERSTASVPPAARTGTGMTGPIQLSDAVLFLSPARQASGLPAEIEGAAGASPLERLAGRLRHEGFVRLRVILLNDEQGPQFRHRLARGLLDRISRRAAAEGIALVLESADSLEAWLAAEPAETDWIVQRPAATESSPAPPGPPPVAETAWFERMQRDTGLGSTSGREPAATGRRALA